jgi:hypothetical protein
MKPHRNIKKGIKIVKLDVYMETGYTEMCELREI